MTYLLKVLCGCSWVLGKPAGMVKGQLKRLQPSGFRGFLWRWGLQGNGVQRSSLPVVRRLALKPQVVFYTFRWLRRKEENYLVIIENPMNFRLLDLSSQLSGLLLHHRVKPVGATGPKRFSLSLYREGLQPWDGVIKWGLFFWNKALVTGVKMLSIQRDYLYKWHQAAWYSIISAQFRSHWPPMAI